MKRALFPVAAFLCALLYEPDGAHAAGITFSPAVTISATTDVSTAGTSKYAYNWNNVTRAINGVTFTGTSSNNGTVGGNLLLAGLGGANATAFSSTTAPFGTLPGPYRSNLIGSVYNGALATTGTVTLLNLLPGLRYDVQIWVSDPRAGGTTQRMQNVSTVGGNTQLMKFNAAAANGSPGQFVIGSFFADAATQLITVAAAGTGSLPQVNMIQVREQSGGPYWNGSVNGSLDTTTTNFQGGLTLGQVTSLSATVFFNDQDALGAEVANTNLTVAAGGVVVPTLSFGNTNKTYTLTGADSNGLTGGSALVVRGDGRVVLAGPNTFSGNATVAKGILSLQHSNALGTSAKTLTQAAAANASGVELEGGVNIPAGITWVTSNEGTNRPAIRSVAGTNRISGVLRLIAGGGFTRVVVDAGSHLTLAGQVTNGTTANRSLQLDGAGEGVVSGIIRDNTNAMAVQKFGSGLWTLTAANTFTGGVAVNSGELRLGTGGKLANHPINQVVVNTGALLTFSNINAISANHGTACLTPIVLNGGTLVGQKESRLGPITLNGGTLVGAGADTNWGAFMLADPVIVTGAAPSVITNTVALAGKFLVVDNGLGLYSVYDVTGDPAADLLVYAPLAAASGHFNSGIQKAGPGTMWLGGINTFTGETRIAAGTLAVGAGATLVSTAIQVQAGAVLDVTAAGLALGNSQTLRGQGMVTGSVTAAASAKLAPGDEGTPGTLTVAGNVSLHAAQITRFDLTNSLTVGGGVNDLLVIGGDLDAQLGTIAVNPLAPLVSGSYRLITYSGSEVIPFSAAVVAPPTRDVLTLDDAGTGVVDLVVVAGAPQDIRWQGAASGDWDLTASNWVDLATGTVTSRFYELDRVTFDELGAAAGTVTLASTQKPGGFFVQGGSNYLLTGAGRLADNAFGVLGLGKDGPGTLTIALTNNLFTGGTVVSNGAVLVGAPGALGPGPVTLEAGALGVVAGFSNTLANAVQVNGAAAGLAAEAGGSLTLSGGLRGPGGLVKTGPGLVTMLPVNPNSYAGGTVVQEGTLRLGYANGGANQGSIRGEVTVQTGAVLWVSISKGIGFANSSSGNVTVLRLNEALLNYTDSTGGLGGGQTVYLNGSEIRSNGGTNSPTAAGYYRFTANGTDSTVYVLGSAVPSVMSGRIELTTTGRFDVADGAAAADLLVPASITAANPIQKLGAGAMVLSGSNTYSGATLIQGGTLGLSGSAWIGASPQILVGAAGVFDVSARPGYTLGSNQILYGRGAVTGDVVAAAGAQIRPDGFNSVHTLTFRSGLGLHAGSTNWFDLTATLGVGGGTNDLVVVGGSLEPSNSVIQVNPLAPLASGTYTLFTYAGAKATTFHTNVLGNATRKTWTLDEATPGLVNLVVAGGYGDLVWRPGSNATWNLALSSNWYDGASTTLFYNADAVTFDDAGAYSNVVTLAGTLLPAAVVVNASSTYVWQGTGKISGTTMVVKAGTGVLEVRTTNDYTQGTIVSNGTLVLYQNNTLGSGPVLVENAGAVAFGTAGVTNGSLFTGTGTIQAPTLGTGTTSLLLTNAASVFTGTINAGPAAAGGGKLVLDNGFGVAATVNISNNATLYLRSGSNHTGALRLEGGDTGEALGQLRLEVNTIWSGPVTLAGDITTAGDGFVGNSTAGNFGFISGRIGESGGPRELSKVGPGTIRLTGTNTYSGGTRISGGVLDVPELADAAPSGIATNGRLTFDGGTLRYSGLADTRTARPVTNAGAATWELTNAVRLTLTGPMAGGGNVFKTGAGTWAWSSNTVRMANLLEINGGTLILDGCVYSNTATGSGDVLGRNAGEYGVVILTNNPIWSKPSQTLWMSIGANATGVVWMHSGRVNAGAGVRMGNAAGGVGAFYQRGGDILSGGEFDAGYNAAAAYGYYGLSGGTLSNGNWVQAGRFGLGVVDVRGGALVQTAPPSGLVVGNNNGTGVFYVAGGLVESAGRLSLGWSGTSRGEFNLAGAALVRVGQAGVMINQTGTTFSVLNLNGGVLETTNIYRQATGGYSVVNFAGGTLRARGSAVLMGAGPGGPLQGAYLRPGGAFVDSSNYTVTITQSLLAPTGGGVTALPWGAPLSGYLGAPYVEISGGGGTGATAVALFDEDSGSVTGLVLTSPGVDYTSGPTVKLLAVGVPDVTLGLATVGDNPSGGLTKLGAGLLALAGTNTYTGVTVVASGTLALNGAHLGGGITVATAAALSGTGVVQGAVAAGSGATVQPGHLGVAGALTVGSAVFAEGAQLNVLAGGTSTLLRVTGTDGLTVPAGAGRLLVNVLNTSLVAGTYTLMDYDGTLQGGAITNVALQTYPPRAVMYLTNNTANSSIDLVVVSTASDAIRWLGVVNGIWNINTTSNWMTIASAQTTAYLQAGSIGDAVVFDDAAAGNFSVTLATSVAPASITASNDLNDYLIAGPFGIGGSGSLTKSGAARFTLATSNSYVGGTVVLGGTLQVGTGGAFCAVGSGFVTNHASLVFHHGEAATQAVAIGGTGSLVKEGAGTLTLTAFNTYTNLTTVNGGTLELAANAGNAGTLSGPLVISTGATVVTKVGNALGYSGTPWVRTITINEGALATAIAGADNGWGLTINMTGGSVTSLVPQGYFSMGATSVVNTTATDHPAWIGANLTIRDTTYFNVAQGSGPADLVINGNLLTASALGIVKQGAGVLVLTGTNTYSGGTQIRGGVLSADFIADGATNVSRIGVAGGSTNYLALQDGTLRYTGAGTNLTTRFLWIDQPQAGSAVDVAATNGVLVLAPAGGNSIHPLTKLGPGTLALGGTGAINSTLYISNGVLLANRTLGTGTVVVANGATLGGTGVVRGAVTQDGVIAPGAGIGTLTVSNQVTDGATAVYRFELGGTNAPTDYDQLVVSDVHTLQGTLEVVVTNGYVPASGDRFVILTNSGLGGLLFGTFSSVSAPALDPGLGWEVQYTGTESASLVVTGTVGAVLTPYEQWAQSITNPALRGEQADADGDGYANLLEYSQGTDATNSADNAKLALVRTNGQFLVLFNRVNSATDIVYEVEGAYLPTNNATWLGIATNVIGSWGGSTNVNDNNTAAVHRVLVTDLLIGTNRSLRLKVTRP